MKPKVWVNGRYAGKRLTGVQRYAVEIVNPSRRPLRRHHYRRPRWHSGPSLGADSAAAESSSWFAVVSVQYGARCGP